MLYMMELVILYGLLCSKYAVTIKGVYVKFDTLVGSRHAICLSASSYLQLIIVYFHFSFIQGL